MMDREGRLGSAQGTRPSSVGCRPRQGGWGLRSPRTHSCDSVGCVHRVCAAVSRHTKEGVRERCVMRWDSCSSFGRELRSLMPAQDAPGLWSQCGSNCLTIQTYLTDPVSSTSAKDTPAGATSQSSASHQFTSHQGRLLPQEDDGGALAVDTVGARASARPTSDERLIRRRAPAGSTSSRARAAPARAAAGPSPR